jgi:polar amino acid transport system permease protein
MDFTWDFSSVVQNYPVLLKGLGMTALLWGIAFPVSMLIGFAMSLGARSRLRALRALTRVYVEVFRNTPVIIQLIWFFYAFPILTGYQLSPVAAALCGSSMPLRTARKSSAAGWPPFRTGSGKAPALWA